MAQTSSDAIFWEREGRAYKWSIEHILPEGKNIPSCWVEMIANGDKALTKQHLENYVHKIGNLTLTAYNSSLSNFAFDK